MIEATIDAWKQLVSHLKQYTKPLTNGVMVKNLHPFENCVVNTVPLSVSKQLARPGTKRTIPASGQHAGMVLSRERERRGSN